MEQTTLYYREGSSDKTYRVSLEKESDGFVVNFQFGRRGATQHGGTKTPAPVDYATAGRLYEKLIAEKERKGYTRGEDGSPYAGSAGEDRVTEISPQLLHPAAEHRLGELIRSPGWWLQEKHDGERRLLQKNDGALTGINRRGLKTALPEAWIAEGLRCSMDFLIDGEAVGDRFYAFDLLSFDGKDVRAQSYLERYLLLMRLLSAWESQHVRLVKSVCLSTEKQRYFEQLQSRGAEGAVFRQIDQPYTSGRPTGESPALKFKFIESASFIVSRINQKRSVSLALLDDGVVRDAGNVTIPVNHDTPQVGGVVEVRYLYAFPESGRVFQPVYHGLRSDIAHEDCSVRQLKYKTAPVAA